jgi:uncharacterized protein (DUF1330 family)
MVYVLITMTPNYLEEESLNEYKEKAKKIRDEYGAEVVLRQNIVEKPIGDLIGESIRLIKFPSKDHVKRWLNDPRYQNIVPLREKGFHSVTLNILEDVE